MQQELIQLQKRLVELSSRSARRQCWTYSEFLNLSEQAALAAIDHRDLEAPFTTDGGYEQAERVLACFGDEEELGYGRCAPIVCVKIEPLSQKFAETLTHRDVLGSVLALGIRREVTGDILLCGNCAYVLCLDSVGEYIAGQLERVRHTSVRCSLTDTLPEGAAPKPEQAQLVIASERLDAVVAAVYRLSRSQSQELFDAQRVFVDGAQTTRRDGMPEPGRIISVPGLGRFRYQGVERETKKGRLRVTVEIYR